MLAGGRKEEQALRFQLEVVREDTAGRWSSVVFSFTQVPAPPGKL